MIDYYGQFIKVLNLSGDVVCEKAVVVETKKSTNKFLIYYSFPRKSKFLGFTISFEISMFIIHVNVSV